jgi:type IV pilus assembly protein PilQ
MKTIKYATILATLLSSVSVSSLVLAGGHHLQDVTAKPGSDNRTEVRLQFDAPVAVPKGMVLDNPPRLVFDFPGMEASPASRSKAFNLGQVESVEAADGKGKTRVVIRMRQLVNYSVEAQGNALVMSFEQNCVNCTPAAMPVRSGSAKAATPVKSATVALPKQARDVVAELPPSVVLPAPGKTTPDPGYTWYVPPVQKATTQAAPPVAQARVAVSPPVANGVVVAGSASALGNVDFRRDADGSGRVIVTLPSADTKVNEDKRGNAVTLSLPNVDVPKSLQQHMDVMDFGTPVSEVDVSQRDMGARIRITAHEGFDYHSQRNGNELTVFVDKLKATPESQLVGDKKKKAFNGEKLSLNFQDIEVRAVLQLLADFTNKNIVVSDTVQGNITVRLKDVPWDQALDIVLESKNLGMRENGNVIWVAPAAELDAKEKQEMEAIKAKQELEPLITEYIPVNFAKAKELAELIQKSQGDNKESLLSPRGAVSVDERTNTLLVKDTVSQVKAIRDMVKTLDVPVQQVLIESRIVTASDEFGKELGARFGVTPFYNNKDGYGLGSLDGFGEYFTTASAAKADAAKNGGFTDKAITMPNLAQRLAVNLPVAGAAGRLGFSVLSKDFMVDLELSALQAESKGEIISTPKVITSNQTKATIEQGVEIPYQEASSSGATSVAFKKAVLSLDVTPQITPDEHVAMDLVVHQDTVGQIYANIPSINTRQIATKVLVENGQTIVLGGVHEEEKVNSSSKVPVLGDLPVLGSLFRSTNNKDNKRELLIFVTPKIIDEKS